jgi:O-antigen/teichoic acid export membrane protein
VITLGSHVAVGLFMVPFLIHGLGDRMYGLWALVSVIVGYYGMLDLGLAEALGRYISRSLAREDLDECNRLVNTALVLYSLLGLAVLVGSLVLSACSSLIWTDPTDASLFASLIVILGLNLALGFPVRAFGGVLQAKLRHDLASGLDLTTLVLRTALIIWVVESGYGLVMLAWAAFIGSVLQRILIVHFAFRQLPSLELSRHHARASTARALFSFSFFLFLSRVSRLLRFQTDALILSTFVGLVAVTHYRVASTLIRYFRQLMIAAFGALLPFFSAQEGRGDPKAMERSFMFSLRASIGISSFVAFAFIAWGRPFIVCWVGEAYLDAYPVLVILALGALLSLWQSTFPTLMYASGRERLGAGLAVADALVKVLLSVVLVQGYGLVGVALGSLISSFVVRLLVQPVLGCRAIGIPYGRYLFQMSAAILRAGLCLLPAVALTAVFSPSSYLSLLAVAVASGGTYLLGIWFLEFSRRERREILRVVTPARRAEREGARLPGPL